MRRRAPAEANRCGRPILQNNFEAFKKEMVFRALMVRF